MIISHLIPQNGPNMCTVCQAFKTEYPPAAWEGLAASTLCNLKSISLVARKNTVVSCFCHYILVLI